MAKKNKDLEDIRLSVHHKKIPILTLDPRWHELFPEYDKPDFIRALEDSLNESIRRQGKLANEMKDLKKLKKQLMTEIVESMDTTTLSTRAKNEKKLNQNKRLIQEINDKLIANENELADLPYLIREKNEELTVQSMAICYYRMQQNREEIEAIDSWIQVVREELKNKLLQKQDVQAKNTNMYSYMHALLGAEVMELFDKNEENESQSR